MRPEHAYTEQYVKAGRQVLYERFSSETREVKFLNLNVSDVRRKEFAELRGKLDDWLQNEDSSRLLLLGAAGSGKSVVCHELALRMADSYASTPGARLPVFLDLGRYAAFDNALDMLVDQFGQLGIETDRKGVRSFVDTHRPLVFLDSFDEYDRAGTINVSDRPFEDFDVLISSASKVITTCRTNFFRSLDEVFHYDMPGARFEICPSGAAVFELQPLSPRDIANNLAPFLSPGEKLPEWLLTLASRPLHLAMLLPLLRYERRGILRLLGRHELYNRFVRHVLKWDLQRPTMRGRVSYEESLQVHTCLAEEFLNHASSALDEDVLRDCVARLHGGLSEGIRRDVLFHYRESGLLQFSLGQLLFAHKSLREYLVARRIFSDIVRSNDDFPFIWFTRAERDFVIDMLGPAEMDTLCRWLSKEERYPACNYAAFILGGTNNQSVCGPLKEQFSKTHDPLVRLNCCVALATLGDLSIVKNVAGIVSGYAQSNELANVPTCTDPRDLAICSELTRRFGSHVMLIHLCEAIEVLGLRGNGSCRDLLSGLLKAPDRSVLEEAGGALRAIEREDARNGLGNGAVARGRCGGCGTATQRKADVEARVATKKTDVGIITMKEEEFEALLDKFRPTGSHRGKQRDYELATVRTLKGPCNIAITRSLKQGNTYAQTTATELLEDLSPRFVLVVGIAGGIPSEDFCLGDVVISDHIHNLTIEDTGSGEERRFDGQGGPLHPSASRIVERLKAVEREFPDWAEASSIAAERPGLVGQYTSDDQNWNRSIREALKRHKGRSQPIATARAVASSDRLVKDPELIRAWRSVLKGISAVEMESAGVYMRCQREQVPVIAVRGLSDIVGWKRNEAWTAYACHSAAAYSRMMVRGGVFISL